MPFSPAIRFEVQALSVARGDRVVVEDLSFAVDGGDVLHVQGRNGAGKTSLLEVLCGLRPANSGRLRDAPGADALHWVGHKNALNLALSPLENLQFWCGLNGLRPELEPTAALERVGLKAQRHRRCASLSTGQRRRAALARLLLAARPWWFLDEPLAGLDAAGFDLLVSLLTEHQAQGGGTVFTSHQPLPDSLPGLRRLLLAA